MATTTSELVTWTQVAGLNSDWDTPTNVRVLDGTAATFGASPPLAGTDILMDPLNGLNMATKIPYGCSVSEVRVKVRAKQDGTASTCSFETVNLCDSTGPLAAVDASANELFTTSYATYTFTFTTANLTTLALTTDDILASTFGVEMVIRRDDDPTMEGAAPFIDSVWVEVDHSETKIGGGAGGDRFFMRGTGYRMSRRGR